jgi:transposase
MEGKKTHSARYVGIDLGKRTYEVAIVGNRGKVTLSNGKTTAAGRQALYKKLRKEDKVALEAGNMAFIMAKEIQKFVGCRVYVLNPSHLALIYGSMKKTDKEDSLKLAHILEDFREERLPEVVVPSDKEMGRRKLLASYRREQGNRTRGINRLHGLFLAQGITDVKKKDLAAVERRRESIERLEGLEKEEAEHILKCLALYEERIYTLEKEMEKEAEGDEQIERLQTVPGVGPKVAFAFVAHVAADRFENGEQVANYLGLVPRVYISGDTVRYGRITKRGNGYVRGLLVQAAWALVRTKKMEGLKLRYEYMTKEKGKSKKKTIVCIARKMAVLLYTLMKEERGYESRPFKVSKDDVEAIVQLAMSA